MRFHWTALLPVIATSAHAAVFVEPPNVCLAPEPLRSSIHYLFGERSLSASVLEAQSGEGYAVTLRVIDAQGDLVLERRFELTRVECADATGLVVAVLEELLRALPSVGLPEPALATPALVVTPPAQIVTQDVTHVTLLLDGALAARLAPFGSDLELGARAIAGSRAQLQAGVLIRQSLPQTLGAGTFTTTGMLLGVGVAWQSESWRTRLEARGGVFFARGFGFAQDGHAWLGWLEAELGLDWRVGSLFLGPRVTASPMRYELRTTTGEVNTVSPYRMSFGVQVPLGETDL